MTCIVGLIDKGTVWMGGDSAGVGDYSITVRADRKVFKRAGFLFGFTHSFRMGQLLNYSFNPPPRVPSKDLMEYMVVDFIDAVRSCLKEGGFARTNNGEETGGCFLVGTEGRLFKVEDDYQVGESELPYDACGCGEDIALGAMFTTRNKPPRVRLKTALEAAATFSAGVCAPFHIEKI